MVVFFAPNRIFAGFLIFFIIMTNLFVTIISVIIIVRKHEKFFMCIRNLSLADDTLEQLGIPKEYYKLRNSVKWILISWLMTICVMWIFDSMWYINKFQDTRVIVILAIINYPFHLNTFMDIIFMFLLRYIGTRFDKINDYIRQLSETEQCGLRCTWKKSAVTRYYVRSAGNREDMLWIAMHLHLELCRIARNINNFFGIQMTLQMISYFVLLTGVFYFQYSTILCLKQMHEDSGENELLILIHTNSWLIMYLTKLLTLNYICEGVSTKAERTKDMIDNLTNFVYFDHIREDIFQFVLQISLQPLKFNGMGLFYFGYNFIRKFIIGIVTILIFMVQMDPSPLSRILISRENNKTCFE
ncbi:uncharacterized protein [Anoplolepis gracilipes]|uniref:uncharacterized protein n=1 Tax=Anoplolepis gracilipes TaxID=354296 RepID=UPI003BA2950B